MKLSITTLFGFLTAFMLLQPIMAQANDESRSCSQLCGNKNRSCAELARDHFLRRFSCDIRPESTFIYNGGETTIRFPNSTCYARYRAPVDSQQYTRCTEIKDGFTTAIDGCLNNTNSGAGVVETPYNYYGISTCGSVFSKSDVVARDLVERQVEEEVDEEEDEEDDEGNLNEMTEEREIAQTIAFLLRDILSVIITGKTVFNFPHSGAQPRTVCQLAEIEPRLWVKFHC